MIRTDKIESLKAEIHRQLSPLITNDYVLLDLPYHSNIGDTLIWEGELSFLAEMPHIMVGLGSFLTWRFPRLDPETIVLLHGGGNFGDVWQEIQEFRLRVVEAYPNNPIVVFPHTVHYIDKERMASDAAQMSAHKNLTICARDTVSLDILTKKFKNKTLLVPDMAFCIPVERLKYHGDVKFLNKALMIRRLDIELAAEETMAQIPSNTEIRDWPTIEKTTFTTWLIYKLCGVCKYITTLELPASWLANKLATNKMRNNNIETGVELIGPYDEIYTTRLHGAILAVLMGVDKIHIIDNSYGKNSSFYATWLDGMEGIEMWNNNKLE